MGILLKIVENFRKFDKIVLKILYPNKNLIHENNVKFLKYLFCKISIEKNIVSDLMLQKLLSR